MEKKNSSDQVALALVYTKKQKCILTTETSGIKGNVLIACQLHNKHKWVVKIPVALRHVIQVETKHFYGLKLCFDQE